MEHDIHSKHYVGHFYSFLHKSSYVGYMFNWNVKNLVVLNLTNNSFLSTNYSRDASSFISTFIIQDTHTTRDK